MIESRITGAFFTLLRAGIWDTAVDRADCFPLSKEEWAAIFRLAVDQTVEGLVFDGVQRLDACLLPELNLLTQWLVRVEKIAQRNTWMNGIVREQLVFFKKMGIEPMLLKGQGLGACYVRPERRGCGDVDWYFQTTASYRKANSAIKESGMQLNFMPGFSASYLWEKCEVEHHSRMLDFHNPFCHRYLQHLIRDEKQNRIMMPLLESQLCLPSPLLQSVQVNAHILKHQLSFGIGLRQLCDTARVYFTYHQQLDGEALKKIYRKTGTEKWIYLLHGVLTKFIGLPKQYLPFGAEENVTADWMMEEILAVGNFGFYDKRGKTKGSHRDKRKIWHNVKTYLPFAPMEACAFPIVHFYSRFIH